MLEKQGAPPRGFQLATAGIGFVPKEKPAAKPYKMNVTLVLLEKDTPSFGGVFTQNAFPGAPVLVNTQRLENPTVRGVLINNRIANVCVQEGVRDIHTILKALEIRTGVQSEKFLSASTGIIGWRLPVTEITKVIPRLIASQQNLSVVPAAEAIMTTDSYPKVRSVDIDNGTQKGRIIGIAKGAGMIEPNMGTLLVFLLTDISIPRDELREQLNWCVDRTFNRISVDGDQSTSDMVLGLSSGLIEGIKGDDFRAALYSVCMDLSEDIVRNGEGVAHVIKVTVRGCPDKELALGTGKAIVNSPLVKTAIFGNDPNVGRIVSSLGDYWGNRGNVSIPEQLTIDMGGINIFSCGFFTIDSEKEKQLQSYLEGCGMSPEKAGYPEHDRIVEISVDMKKDDSSVEVYGADLSYEYIRENAEYRS